MTRSCQRRSRFGRCSLPKDHPDPTLHATLVGNDPPCWFAWRVSKGRAVPVGVGYLTDSQLAAERIPTP